MWKTTKNARIWPITQTKRRSIFFKKGNPALTGFFVFCFFHTIDSAVASGDRCGNPVTTTLTTTSNALIQLRLTCSWKCCGPRALSRKATRTTAKFCCWETIVTDRYTYIHSAITDQRATASTHAKVRLLDVVFPVTLSEVFQLLHQRRAIV